MHVGRQHFHAHYKQYVRFFFECFANVLYACFTIRQTSSVTYVVKNNSKKPPQFVCSSSAYLAERRRTGLLVHSPPFHHVFVRTNQPYHNNNGRNDHVTLMSAFRCSFSIPQFVVASLAHSIAAASHGYCILLDALAARTGNMICLACVEIVLSLRFFANCWITQ